MVVDLVIIYQEKSKKRNYLNNLEIFKYPLENAQIYQVQQYLVLIKLNLATNFPILLHQQYTLLMLI